MTCSYHVVFLLDAASSLQKTHLHLGILKILNYLGCKFGVAKVWWGFKFFDSLGVKGRSSRVGSFRELSTRSWEDFEEELEARFQNQDHALNLSVPTPRATFAQNILKEALLDYQWERPEIASPTKPALRCQKSKLTVTSEKPQEGSDPSEGFLKAVFLFSPCPHSQRELLQFVTGNHDCLHHELLSSQDLAEKFIPTGIQEMMVSQKITLHWIDVTDDSKLLDTPDNIGYHILAELMHNLRGTILPSEIFLPHLRYHRAGTLLASPLQTLSPEPSFSLWATILPVDSALNRLFASPSALQASFPQMEGQLFIKRDEIEELQSCAVTLEPLTVNQRCFDNPVNISLKCTMAGWNMMHATSFHTESWIMRSSPRARSVQEMSLFQHLVRCILTQDLHLVAEVSSLGSCSPSTGIFSPVSSTAAVLSLLSAERTTEVERGLLLATKDGNFSGEDGFCFPEREIHAIHQVNEPKGSSPASPAKTPFPEWAQQELSRTHPWNHTLIEGWYPLSDLCGASSHLMESLRLLQAAPAPVDEAVKPELELTQSLSELYQKRTAEVSTLSCQPDHKKRRRAPRTPVRQKMKTMPRSLRMLNTARLNVKSQKLQPDEELVESEKVAQRLLPRRSDDKAEGNEGTKLDIKTEEELVSYTRASYQKALADNENLSSCARDIVAAVNTFQRTSEVQERMTDTIRSSLLKTSKDFRQKLGNSPDKQVKVRECQLQVYLRLEMSLQCPLLQSNTDEMEELIEEMTDLLRILSVAEDPAYLTRFLEDVVETYMESIPKTLASLYYSLGTQVPPKLASVLPADFFGDDSISQEGQAPSLPPSTASDPAAQSASVSSRASQLEELRTRSAQKRKNTLSRHRSVTESSQSLRQIEIPQVPKVQARKNSSQTSLDMKPSPAAQKTPVQEVTKVRRNLFNEEGRSPSKASLKRISRSQSVSVLEGLKPKNSQWNKAPQDHHKLLTTRVAETPLHKQISRRLLYRQIQGRCSDPGSEVGVVEESPEKALTWGLRRSPRIKLLLLDRKSSGSLSSFRVDTKCVQQVHPGPLERPDIPEDSADWALLSPQKVIQSPESLLFGALQEVTGSGGATSPKTKRKSPASDNTVAYQTPRKTPRRCSQRLPSPPSNILKRSPRIQELSRRAPSKSPGPKQSAARNLGSLFSPPERNSKPSPVSTEKKGRSSVPSALSKKSAVSPRNLWQLRTPRKQAAGKVLDEVFDSPIDGFKPAPCFEATAPFPSSPWGKFPSELRSPRRSLRTTQKQTFQASAQSWAPETENLSGSKAPLPQLKADSVPSDLTTRKFGVGPLEQSLNSKRPGDVPPPASQSSFTSSPCRELQTGCVPSPQRTQEIANCTPEKSHLKPPSASAITPVKSSSYTSEESLHAHGSKEGHRQWDVRSSLSAESSPFCKLAMNAGGSLMQRYEQTSATLTPIKKRGGSGRHLSPELLAKNNVPIQDAIVVCKHIDPSAPASTGSYTCPSNSPPDHQGPAASQERVLPTEECLYVQHRFFPSPPKCSVQSSVPKLGSRTYVLRSTPDRRQREAAARLGNLEAMANLTTPPRAHTPPLVTSPATYEVELEMQASGLPKLRFKRVRSAVLVEPHSPAETQRCQGEGSDLDTADRSVSLCEKHSGKPEPACISPSCFRVARTTPGKLGGEQTYICQSYTTSHCISSTISPSNGNSGISLTSPKQKGKATPEAIKDWPRRKRAVVGCSRGERQADPAGEMPGADEWGVKTKELFGGGRTPNVGEFELEGVCRLQDQSPCSDTERDESVHRGTSGLKSRKRIFEPLSEEEEEEDWEAKRACLTREDLAVSVYPMELFGVRQERAASVWTNLEKEDVFHFSAPGLTPPSSSVKSSLSTSSLQALTQSPLLYQGRAASRRKRPPEDNTDRLGVGSEDLSPFSRPPPRRSHESRTYSRKRLLS